MRSRAALAVTLFGSNTVPDRIIAPMRPVVRMELAYCEMTLPKPVTSFSRQPLAFWKMWRG
jgi:hypothetical protein